jgi:hypothetical protein
MSDTPQPAPSPDGWGQPPTIEQGRVYEVAAPFIRVVASRYEEDEDGRGTLFFASWRPGVLYECAGPYGDDTRAYCHGVGKAIFRCVSIATLPRPYPARVFFTRSFITPDKKAFGKQTLRLTTVPAFRRRISGWGQHYEVEPMPDDDVRAMVEQERARFYVSPLPPSLEPTR